MSTGLCNSDNPCVPMCRDPATKPVCGAGELLKDKNTCVKKEMCPCIKPDGTIAQVQVVNCLSHKSEIVFKADA